MKRMAFLTLIFIILSCEKKTECLNEFLTFKNHRESPMISIVEKTKASCEFQIKSAFCFNLYSVTDGLMFIDGDKIYIKAIEPTSSYFLLFDLSKKAGEKYESQVDFRENDLDLDSINLKIEVENILEKNKRKVTVFRVKNFGCYDDGQFDIVFFVTRENGVIGSYTSDIVEERNLEFMISPQGDILEDMIDYSKMTRATLK